MTAKHHALRPEQFHHRINPSPRFGYLPTHPKHALERRNAYERVLARRQRFHVTLPPRKLRVIHGGRPAHHRDREPDLRIALHYGAYIWQLRRENLERALESVLLQQAQSHAPSRIRQQISARRKAPHRIE